MKIFTVSDFHYCKKINSANPERHGEYAPELLKKCVDIANNIVEPDIFLAAGDIVDNPADDHLLGDIAEILNELQMPYLAVPGNHDPAPEIFYKTIPQVPDYLDVNGFRFVPFPYDRETPGWNAYRETSEIERLGRINKDLPVIMFQHVPLFKNGRVGCWYNYDNADEIIERSENVVLSISGHWHFGFCPSFAAPFASVAVPSLCEDKYAYSIIELDSQGKMISFGVKYLETDE